MRQIEWDRAHIAITTEALERSVIRRLNIRGAYPEKYLEAYRKGQEDQKKGSAAICTTSIQEWRKAH